MAQEPSWTTPSGLAEYAFCPRAHYYRLQAEAPPTSAVSDGVAYHQQRLSSERWRDEHPRAPWVAVACGVTLLVLAFALGVV